MKNEEFEIKNLTEVDTVIAAIKANFEKVENEQASIVIKYNPEITVEDLEKSLELLWKYEIESEHTVDILIKNLSYGHRKAALGCALKTSQLRNPIFLQNIFCLIKGYNSFADSYFNHEQVFLNDEVEFLDIFDDLEEEIKAVTKQLAEYYVSMLKTCNLVEAVENNPNAVEMENLYKYLFSIMDVTILARVLSSVKDSTIWETNKIVLNSLAYLGAVAEKFVFVNTFLESMTSIMASAPSEN